MKLLKTVMATSAIALSLVATKASAQDKSSPVVIAAGMEGGGYDKFAKAMATRLGQRGYSTVSVTNHNGSDAITLAACNGKANIWLAQIDAIYTRYQEGCVLSPVADYGTEVAVLLVPPKSDIDELSDLSDKDSIAVDGIGSGTELFWKTIVAIENGDNGNKNDWAKATAVESSPEMLNTMANFGDIQAALLVRKENSDHIKLLLNQGWTLAELWDKDIDDEEFNNLPLYESGEVKISYTKGDAKAWAYKVRSFVGVSKASANDRGFKTDVSASTQ